MNEQSPLLSVGIIFKNEIRCIERCLKSLQPLRELVPMEIVMADTGSEDGSREVAEKYADILIDFPWIGDFAAARNSVIERCSGVWHLAIDCDEWFEDVKPLADFILDPASLQWELVLLKIKNFMSITDSSRFSIMFGGRLSSMQHVKLRYSGKIHETPTFDGRLGIEYRLPEVVIYHDGYAMTPEQWEKKSERNMEMLRETLRSNPYDLRILVQNVQSARNPVEKLKLAKRTMRALKDRRSQDSPFRSSAYQNSAIAAQETKNPDLMLTWLDEGLEEFPESIFLCVDCCSIAMEIKMSQGDMEAALEYGKKWRSGLKEFQEKGNNLPEMRYGWLNFMDETYNTKFSSLLVMCIIYSNDWEYAQEILDELSEQRPSDKSDVLRLLTTTVLQHADELDGRAYLKNQWERALAGTESEDGEERNFAKKCISWMLEGMGKAISDPEMKDDSEKWNAMLEMLSSMGPYDPARSARIMLSEDPAEMRSELSQIQIWGHIFFPAIAHMIECCVPMTDNFFEISSELMNMFAAQVIEGSPEISFMVLPYVKAEDTERSLPRRLWALNLVSTVLGRGEWPSEEEAGELFDMFESLEFSLLDLMYKPEVFKKENISVMSPVHRFGYRLRLAEDALKNGDKAQYLRLLREGVKDVPDMKKIVEFLRDRMKAETEQIQEASAELLALAERVKGILSGFDPDDPAVLDLKNSAIYKKVAWIIEDDNYSLDKQSVNVN